MATMKNIYIFILVLLGIWIISACTSNSTSTPSDSRIYVASLEENWERIHKEALAWQTDAYLTGAILPIIVDYPRSGQTLINAYYFSVIDNRKMLRVSLSASGEISSDISDLDEPLHDPAILREDWEINSVDALRSLLTNSDVDILISNPETQCSNLTLEKQDSSSEQTTVWRILVHDCGLSAYVHKGKLDALTGEQVK
jgi:hypothetical protein